MSCDEYFNTRAGTLIYGQVRSSPVIDGVDKNTFTYPNDTELKILLTYFGAENVKAEKEFIDKQAELVEKEVIDIKEIISR